MYRGALLKFLRSDNLTKLHQGPDVRILLSRPPKWVGPHLAAPLGFFCYQVEKALCSPLHPHLAEVCGFRPQTVSVRECASAESLADLILASSCTPPFTPVLSWKGRAVLDGGLIDNVPERALKTMDGNILYLLTRTYAPKAIRDMPGRTYIQPFRPIRISKWDYTDPAGLQEAYQMGQEDGERFLKRMKVQWKIVSGAAEYDQERKDANVDERRQSAKSQRRNHKYDVGR
jgi:predicted acylesterase/phospholipase RssA